MKEIFRDYTIRYNLQHDNEFFIQPRVRSINNGSESVRFKGLQLSGVHKIQTGQGMVGFSENLPA